MFCCRISFPTCKCISFNLSLSFSFFPQVPEWMLTLKPASKQEKRQLADHAPERGSISSTPAWVRQKAEFRRGAIEGSKNRAKRQRQLQDQKPQQQTDTDETSSSPAPPRAPSKKGALGGSAGAEKATVFKNESKNKNRSKSPAAAAVEKETAVSKRPSKKRTSA